MPRRYESDEQAAALAVLAVNGGNVSKTARELGIPRMTLRDWAAARKLWPSVDAERVEDAKRDLAEALERVAWQLLDAIPGKIEAASLAQVATGMGIAIDKARLIRGEPTVVSEDVTAARDALNRKLALLAERNGAAGVSLQPDGE